MKKFRIIVTWNMMGSYIVNADTLEDAIDKVEAHETPLPKNGSYLEDSFEVDRDMSDEVTEGEMTAFDEFLESADMPQE